MQEAQDRDLAGRRPAAAAENQFADQQFGEHGRAAERSDPHRDSVEADLESTKNNTLTTKQLASQLYLSVPTTLKVINDCRSWLKLFNIELNVVRNKGLELAYNEVSYRLALKHFILKFDTETNVEESILFFMPGLDLDAIRRGIMETEKEWSFEFAEESFNEVLVYASLAIYQNQQKNGRKLKFSDEELEMLQKYNEYSFAEAIFKSLGRIST